MTADPPPIPGVRRSFVEARGVRFHVTEAGPEDGRPVVALHGWPQHHWVYRDLLADPPAGLRIIAPDLPGYGWSGPPPHRWAKQDVADDVVALLDAMGLDRVLMVGHDWGGWVGQLVVLTAPERIEGYLLLNMAHVWQKKRIALRHVLPFVAYQPLVATVGVPLQQQGWFLEQIFRIAADIDPAVTRVYVERFRDPVVARAGSDTYRTFLLREVPAGARHPENRRATVPIRVLFGIHDAAIHPSLAAAETANADDYTVEKVDAGHFILDERPDLVRAKLIALAKEFPL